jgi:hypothetical protein
MNVPKARSEVGGASLAPATSPALKIKIHEGDINE